MSIGHNSLKQINANISRLQWLVVICALLAMLTSIGAFLANKQAARLRKKIVSRQQNNDYQLNALKAQMVKLTREISGLQNELNAKQVENKKLRAALAKLRGQLAAKTPPKVKTDTSGQTTKPSGITESGPAPGKPAVTEEVKKAKKNAAPAAQESTPSTGQKDETQEALSGSGKSPAKQESSTETAKQKTEPAQPQPSAEKPDAPKQSDAGVAGTEKAPSPEKDTVKKSEPQSSVTKDSQSNSNVPEPQVKPEKIQQDTQGEVTPKQPSQNQ